MNNRIFYSVPLLLLSLGAYAGETAPLYQNEVLTIPRVDLPDAVGRYQNVQFKRAADGRWDLIQVSEAKLAKVEQVVIEKTDTLPVQVLVKVTGNLPNGCYSVGEVFIRKEANDFTVAVNQKELQTFAVCAQALVPFEITVPLEVYGLFKGLYTVNVNGVIQSFVLGRVAGEFPGTTTIQGNTAQ